MVRCLKLHFYHTISSAMRNSPADTYFHHRCMVKIYYLYDTHDAHHKSAVCFHTRKPQTSCSKSKHSHLFSPKCKTLKKGNRWHALIQCFTLVSGRTSYIHSGHSVSVRWLWVTLCTMKRDSFRAGLSVCVCVWMPQIKDEACHK